MGKGIRTVVLWLAVLLCVRAQSQLPPASTLPPLVATGTPVSMEQWISRLADADPEVRANAAEALGKLDAKAAPAVKPLVARLKDQNADVRFYAAWALGHIGCDARRVVPALLAAMKDPDDDTRMQATFSLTVFPQSARQIVPTMTMGLAGSDKLRRYHCLQCIGEFGKASRGAVPLLIQATSDPELDIRLLALHALEEIGITSPEVDAVLITALNKEGSMECHAAQSALGKIGASNMGNLSALAGEFGGEYRSEAVTSAVAFARLLSRMSDARVSLSHEEHQRLIALCEAAQKALQGKFNPYGVPATTIESARKQMERSIAALKYQ